jgi:hypothetical protein
MAHRPEARESLLRVNIFVASLLAFAVLIVRGGTLASERNGVGERRVRVVVVASDSAGHPLSYRWRSTDGVIEDVNSPSTTWWLPSGPGLHFAYVLVSNGVGGYTERRVAVNTDSMDEMDEDGEEWRYSEPRNLVAPPAPAQQGDYYRSYVSFASSAGMGTNGAFRAWVDQPDVQVSLQDTTTASVPPYPLTGPVSTDISGQFVVNFPYVTDKFNVTCAFGLGFAINTPTCGSDSISNFVVAPPARMAATDYPSLGPVPPLITGSLTLQDGSVCGSQDEFFSVHVNATATLLDANGNVLGGPVQVNSLGYYELPEAAGAFSVVLQCEQASPVVVAISSPNPTNGNDLGQSQIANVLPPLVSSMSATRDGKSVGIFLPPASGLPSDLFPRDNRFGVPDGI